MNLLNAPEETQGSQASPTPAVDVEEKDDPLDAWFSVAINMSKWERFWRSLLETKQELREKSSATSNLPASLETVRQMIKELHTLCEEMPSTSTWVQFQNLASSILWHIKLVLDNAVYFNKDVHIQRNTVRQMDYHLVPEMITLVMLCYENYGKSGGSAYDCLHEALKLPFKYVNQIDALHRLKYLTGKSPSASLRFPLTRLLKAMDLHELDERVQLETEEGRDDSGNANYIPRTQTPWTTADERNLLSALQRYTSTFLQAGQPCASNVKLQRAIGTF